MLFYDMLQGANYYPQFDNHEMKPLQDLCKEINKHCLFHEGLRFAFEKILSEKILHPQIFLFNLSNALICCYY